MDDFQSLMNAHPDLKRIYQTRLAQLRHTGCGYGCRETALREEFTKLGRERDKLKGKR